MYNGRQTAASSLAQDKASVATIRYMIAMKSGASGPNNPETPPPPPKCPSGLESKAGLKKSPLKRELKVKKKRQEEGGKR